MFKRRIDESKIIPICDDFCYIFAIPKAGSEPVISFLNMANSFCGVCLFYNFARNKIYVISKNWLQVVLLVSVNDKGGSNEEIFGNIVNRDFFIFS
jgi:hypothetical protein